MGSNRDVVVSQVVPFDLPIRSGEGPKASPTLGSTATVSEAPQLTTLRVAQTYVSANALARVTGAVGPVSGSVGGSGERFVLQYEALLEGTPELQITNGVVTERVPAVGVVVELTVTRRSADFRADIYSVGAAATLNAADVQFTRKIMAPADANVMKDVKESDTLTSNTYEPLLNGVAEVLKSLAKLSNVKPSIYYRPGGFMFTQREEIQEALAVCYAASQVAQGVRLDEALRDAPRRQFDVGVVRTTYEYFWPNPGDGSPPRSARDAAKKLLGW